MCYKTRASKPTWPLCYSSSGSQPRQSLESQVPFFPRELVSTLLSRTTVSHLHNVHSAQTLHHQMPNRDVLHDLESLIQPITSQLPAPTISRMPYPTLYTTHHLHMHVTLEGVPMTLIHSGLQRHLWPSSCRDQIKEDGRLNLFLKSGNQIAS